MCVLDNGIEIFTVTKNEKDQQKEIYEFSDIVKIMPTEGRSLNLIVERNDEFNLFVGKFNHNQIYTCTALQELRAEYLKALDYYLLRKSYTDTDLVGNLDALLAIQTNQDRVRSRASHDKESPIHGKVNKYIYVDDLKMAVSNVSNAELYSVRVMVSRSSIKIRLLQTDDTAASSKI